MTITVKHIHGLLSIDDNHTIVVSSAALYLIIEGADDIAAFKKLVQQGSNLEPNMTASMKELADLVTSGEILQNYRGMK